MLDLLVINKKNHVIKVSEALKWSAFWILLAFAFNILIFFTMGYGKALQFLTGYVIEKSLSVDNLFVFLVVFSYFKVPAKYQHKVLFYGIIGALVSRAIFIFAGISLVERFHVAIYFLGAFLVIGGLKMLFQKDLEIDPGKSFIIKIARRFIPVLKRYHDDKFFVVRNSVIYATPLFIVLIVVETTDIIFALDSIPAIIAITADPFIVFSSNIFAILGLRSLFFALAGIMGIFHYLKYGLSVILMYVGVKLLIIDIYKLDVIYSLFFIAFVLLVSVLASIIAPKKEVLEPAKKQAA